ncbi:MAG: molybdate ABC transporter substrate-binding protein [Candidatus Synoicihabitans palmerolidicus]|nr:molybdate ABC transporter substrate-binding protein [Candidatus Synoicihabitans palmerolidicus]
MLRLTPLRLLAAPGSAFAEKITAAASNLARVTPALVAAFTASSPATKVTFVHASTGNLVAQIHHGAPFDVLLAADLAYPQSLVSRGDGIAGTLFTFGHGCLVLLPAPPNNPADWPRELASPTVSRIAIANPATAPYGRAAKALLERHHIWLRLQPRIVEGENVAQALQFAHSGNVNYAFVAASLLTPEMFPGLPQPQSRQSSIPISNV